MPLTRSQLRRKRMLEATKPEAPADGMYFFDQINGQGEIFISFDELKHAAIELMTFPEDFVEAETGKMPYQRDPTYNMRRRRS